MLTRIERLRHKTKYHFKLTQSSDEVLSLGRKGVERVESNVSEETKAGEAQIIGIQTIMMTGIRTITMMGKVGRITMTITILGMTMTKRTTIIVLSQFHRRLKKACHLLKEVQKRHQNQVPKHR